MPFYFLHEEGTQVPKDESAYEFLIYNKIEMKPGTIVVMPLGEARRMCSHKTVNAPQWDPDDEAIEVLGKHDKRIIARFDKVFDIPGFTIWANLAIGRINSTK